MEGRVDFPLERGRLLAPALPSGSLGPLGSAYAESPALGRPTVSDITRAGSPATMSALGHYQGRYMPPSMSVHSQGASFALMGSYLSGSGHASESLKSLMPDVQQYWGPAHTDGFHRYVINNNLYPPYPFQLGAESLSLLPGGVGASAAGPAQQSSFAHRIYELHKDPYLTNPAAAVTQAGYFNLSANPVSLPSRPASPQPPGIVTFKQENKYDPQLLHERVVKPQEKRSHNSRHETVKHAKVADRGDRCTDVTEVRSDIREKARNKKSESSASVENSCKKVKVMDEQKEVVVDEKPTEKVSAKHSSTSKTSNSNCNVKTQNTTTLSTVTVTASGTTQSQSATTSAGSTQSVFTCVQPVTVATTQGSPISSVNSVNSQGKTASALPYYHNIYSQPQGSSTSTQGPRKVYATTFVPEVGTVGGPLEKSLPKICETRVKSETGRSPCCGDKHICSSKVAPCPPSTVPHTDRSSDSASSKHSTKSPPRLHLSGDSGTQEDGKQISVSSSAEVCSAQVDVNEVGSDVGRSKECDKTNSRDHNPNESDPVDYSNPLSTKTGRVCARHHVKASPSKSLCATNSKVEQKVSAQVPPSPLVKIHECQPSDVSSTSPEPKPDSTTSQDHLGQINVHHHHHRPLHHHHLKEEEAPKNEPSSEAALNLTKSRKTVHKGKGRALVLRKTEGSADREKRCGSAPPQTAISSSQDDVIIDPGTEQQQEVPVEKVEENQEHTGGNIPVGIAVARKRTEQPRAQESLGGRPHIPPPDVPTARGVVEDDDTSRQYSQDREEFLRQQKAILSGPAKVTVNAGLPPNLVVTGSVAGSDTSLQDDLRVRSLANQWVAAGHAAAAVNSAPWLAQNPFALHPAAITTTSTTTLDPNPFPATAPSGFKIAQDSFTGNLFLIPADYVEQGSALWPFPTGPGPQPPHFQSLLQTSPSTHLTQLAPPGSPAQIPEDQSAGTPDQLESRQSPETADQRDGSERGSEGPSRTSTPGSRPASGSGKEKTPTPQSPPGTPGSLQDREKPISLPNPYIPDMAVAAQQYTYPYAAGHLPYVFNPGLIPMQGVPVNLSEPLTVKTEPPSVQSRGTSPMVLTPPPSDETSKVEPTFKEAAVYADFPQAVTKCCASVQTCDPPPPSVLLKEQCSQTCIELDLSRTETLLKAAEKLNSMTDCASQSEPLDTGPTLVPTPKPHMSVCVTSSLSKHSPDYNPFTDPLILKAADGLELLSTLAERRSKCAPSSSSTLFPPTSSSSSSTHHSAITSPSTFPVVLHSPTSISSILPSPSDSFKSDNNLTAEETSSVDAERNDVTPKRDVKRGTVSPKWTFPKKDANPPLLTIGGVKIPSGLDSMDAIEVEMRMRLAELQRRYKEKQRELAKLQPKVKDPARERRDSKEDDSNSIKRKPGRPRKRKFFTKKKDEESPGKSGCKESHSKRKRLPEELVDRVFRKLPPVKSDKLKSMRTKSGFFLKRRSGSSLKSSTDSGSNSRDSFLGSGGAEFEDKKFFKSKGANIAKGKFKPFAKRRDETAASNGNTGDDDTTDTGNLFSNIENSLVERKRPKTMLKGLERQRCHDASQKDSTSPQSVSPSMLESGLGLLAKFATSALSAANMRKRKRKPEEGVCLENENESDESKQGPVTNRVTASDTEASDTPTTNKKRKPGRPKKCTPMSTGGGTETIVDRKSKTLGLLHLTEVGNKDKKSMSKQEPREIKLDGSKQLKPLYLDEEWCLRRSERIFLSEPSPQPSPNNLQSAFKQDHKAFLTPRSSKTSSERDRDRAKVQKAKSLQELSQKVKRKYTKNMNKDRLSFQRSSLKSRMKSNRAYESDSDQDSGSDGDNIPLSALRRRPHTPEPRSCVMVMEDLKDGLRVLELIDGLFYEGALKAINPPDIYGVVVDNQRGTRPHIYPQEEILKNVIVDVKPGSPRFLPEGTRVCAYWSQQFSCLYPGTVAKTSPNPHADKFSVNVEFDDGDSGRIPIDHIRLLPQDFPLVSYDPNPLLNLSKRRRRTTSDDSEYRRSSDGYFSLSESRKRGTKTFSGQFDEAMEEEESEDPDVFETEVRKKSQSRDHTQKQPSNRTGSENIGSSQFGSSFQCKDNRSLTNQSPRRDDCKPSSILRPSAFDMKKLGFQYGGRSDSSSDEEIESSDGEGNAASGDEESYSDEEEEEEERTGEESSKKTERKSGSKAISRKKSSDKSVHPRGHNTISAGPVPGRQLWKWSGKSTKRPGLKGKAKKEFYKAIVRGNELIRVGDCAVFLSTGRQNLPFIGRIENMWEAWGGQMTVRVKWFYHPEETKGGKKLADPRGALFESQHEDENDVQTIAYKCEVLPIYDFRLWRAEACKKDHSSDGVKSVYYLAGYYDPTIGLVKYEPDVL